MKPFPRILFFTAILLSFAFSKQAFSHEGMDHKQKEASTETISRSLKVLESIDQTYNTEVKAIFETSCFDCHSTKTNYPWYYKVPGIKGIIDEDISEARKHLDITNGFPFSGHGNPTDDLKAIKKTINKNKMPPLRYKALHWNAWLSEEDIEVINQWINESFDQIQK